MEKKLHKNWSLKATACIPTWVRASNAHGEGLEMFGPVHAPHVQLCLLLT